jgi:hypothetical protein
MSVLSFLSFPLCLSAFTNIFSSFLAGLPLQLNISTWSEEATGTTDEIFS